MTQEFEYGFAPMAKQFKMYESEMGNGKIFHFSKISSGGWFTQIPAARGLFVSSMWFTPKHTLAYTMEIEKPCMLLFGIDCGDIAITAGGIGTRHFTPINHIFVSSGKPFKITFPAEVHTCCTCILVFEEYLQSFLKPASQDRIFNLSEAKDWLEPFYNTPDITLILEQMKWGARNGVLPYFYYECKTGELFSVILKNAEYKKTLDINRRYHITWENEQKLWRIKAIIDGDILNPPSVDALAMTEALSVSKLHRCFKKYYKMTILEYIRIEKMKRAMLMLAADELSIKNIAHQCGYESASKFTHAFKEIHNITPSQYRKAYNL